MESLNRSYSTKVTRASDDSGNVTFAINTSAVDSYGTVIEPSGVDLTRFKTNPVVLFNHNHDQPIGIATNVFERGGKLYAEVKFDEEDSFAANIARKVRDGFIRGASIGFQYNELPVDKEVEGLDRAVPHFESTELMEFSVVSVPSNQEALALARSKEENEIKTLVKAQLAEISALRTELAEVKEELRTFAESQETVEAAIEEEAEQEVISRSAEEIAAEVAEAEAKAALELRQVIKTEILKALGKA
jgi:HK97 family phage prohead protease